MGTPPPNSLHPAERLVQLRQILGLSQRELAKEFQVSAGAIAQWETGERAIPGPILRLVEIYEKAMPIGTNKPASKPAETLLKEFTAGLPLKDSEEVREILNQLQGGLSTYFEDASSLNALTSKLKSLLIQRLVKSLKTSKGVSVKIAQMASFLEMGLPVEVRGALGTLQSRMQPSKPNVIRDLIESEYGRPLKEIFPVWRSEPIAVTSIGQVHYAQLADGQEVAVKVQHPEIRKIFLKQFQSMDLLKFLGSILGKNDHSIVEEIQRALLQECDYQLEALNQEKFRNILSENPRVMVPYVHRELVRPRVLVTEFVKGECFQSFASRATQAQRNAAAETILESLSTAVFGYGLNYTDWQLSNFMFFEGKVVILDFGRVIDMPRDGLKLESQFYLTLLNRDYEKGRVLASGIFAKDPNSFNFNSFWDFLQKTSIHLMVDENVKFNRNYARSITHEAMNYSKKHELKMNKDAFWAFVFSAASWGVLAELDAVLNMRRVALKTISMGKNL